MRAASANAAPAWSCVYFQSVGRGRTAAVLFALLAASCGDAGESDTTLVNTAGSEVVATTPAVTQQTTTTTVTPTTASELARPPLLIVTSGEASIRLNPWSYCWEAAGVGTCADGIPSEALPVLSVTEPMTFAWLGGEGQFRVSSNLDGSCPQRSVTVAQLEPFVPFDCDVLDITGIGRQGDAIYRLGIESTIAAGVPGPEVSWSFTPSDVPPTAGVLPEVAIVNFDGEITQVSGIFSIVWEDFVLEAPVRSESYDGGTLLWPDINFGDTPVPDRFNMLYDVEINGTQYLIGGVIWPDDFSAAGAQGPIGSLIPAD